ncbi:MAG TPA: protein kinase [Gemmatimonadaceae bacterium]|nr:protein kinase [Gemmatimonadaceae bacterium]
MEFRDQLQAALGDAYRLERELGGGGMSRVFLADDTVLERKVVVKVLPPELAASVSIERFKREISLAARLQHPHVVPLLSAGRCGDLPFFTMPFIEGESLRERLLREGEMAVSDGVRILREIASALDAAHEKGIVHRDIKPDNVMLSRGCAMVTDFGVAKALSMAAGGSRDRTLTSLGVALGTPAYMSPEQASANDAIDGRADIYSWGVLAYEVFTGRPPFAGRTPQATLAAQMIETPESVSRLRPSLPAALATLVMRCLEKHPADRPRSAAELVQELDAIHTPVGGSHSPSVRPPAQPSPRGAVRRVLIGGAVALAVAGVITAGVLLADRPPAARAESSERAVVVLPFEEVGGDPANDYFGAGMADALTSALSKVSGVTVRTLPSGVFRPDQPVNLAEIGRSLGVFAVIDGKVQRQAGRLRLTAALTRVTDGTVLWSESYIREMRDVFTVQDDLARSVSSALATRFASPSGTLVAAPTTDLEAYDLYLQGRFLWAQRTGPSLRAAIGLFNQAIDRDPRFVAAYVGLAEAYIVFPQYAYEPAIDSYRPAEEAMRRALALDSTNAEVHASLGMLHAYQYRWTRAEEEFRRAIALAPQYATIYHWYGLSLGYQGKYDRAIAELEHAMRLDPHSRVMATAYTMPLVATGQTDRARRELERVLVLDPGFSQARRRLARLYAQQGDYARAESEMRLVLSGAGFSENGLLAYVLARAGRRVEAERIATELVARTAQEYVSPTMIALAFLGLDDHDAAFRWLNRAVDEFEKHSIEINMDPIFAPLRDDPRYRQLLSRMNLT